MMQNNIAAMTGQLAHPLTVDHEIMGEAFYTSTLIVKRLSGAFDSIPVTVPGKLFDTIKPETFQRLVTVTGSIRSYIRTQPDGSGNHNLTLFASSVEPALEEFETQNEVTLTGSICKAPTFRFTPFGREISDTMLAVNRGFGKGDYIPLVVWGRNAKWTSRLRVGDTVTVRGRLQSRDYEKLQDDGSYQRRTVNELSVFSIEHVPAEVRASV